MSAALESAAPADSDRDDDESFKKGLVRSTPAWLISMLVQIVVLLTMALIVNPPPETQKPRVISSSKSDADETFTEFEDSVPVENPVQSQDAVADVVVPTDVAPVENVNVVAAVTTVDAAPVAVELTDFGSETAPAADMLASMGAAGTKAGSISGRRADSAKLAKEGGGGEDTESAVDKALKWFIRHQMPDGGWDFDLTKCSTCGGKCSKSGKSPDRSAATCLALLPFLGKGYTHKDGPYKKQVENGLAFISRIAMENNGQAYLKGGNLYTQGLAGITLSECMAMTQDERLRAPTQMVLNFIMTAQDPVGGGWRYAPRQPGDTSAVGWQIMALKSGNMAYMQINPATIKNAVKFLDSVQTDSGAYYGYATPQKGRTGTTAVGLLCRMYLGWKKDHPALQEGVKFIAKAGPGKDLYYDYYATQVMHHMEGDLWKSWNARMKKMLTDSQQKSGHEDGSWFEGFETGHGPDHGGRIYTTSLATMILEVYYRPLPIYRNQVVEEDFKE